MGDGSENGMSLASIRAQKGGRPAWRRVGHDSPGSSVKRGPIVGN